MLKYGYNESDVTVTNLTVNYIQGPDGCEDSGGPVQCLQLTAEDGGGGPFIRMSLPDGGHFSVSDIHDLEKIFEDFYAKLNYEMDDIDKKWIPDTPKCPFCKFYNRGGNCNHGYPAIIDKCFVSIKDDNCN